MVKKMIFAFGIMALGVVGTIPTNHLQASNYQVFNYAGDISYGEKILVCCELDAQRFLTMDTALALLRDGSMTITKIDSGVYRVVYPGGMLDIILEIDD